MADRKTTLVAVDVLADKYKSGAERVKRLKKAGYNPTVIQNEVNRLLSESKKKSIDTLAHEVIDGLWRSGDIRKKALTACGCNYNAIQDRVNEILNPHDKKPYPGPFPTLEIRKTNEQVIEDTITWAKWTARNNRFHYGHGEHAHHNGCYYCGTQKLKMGHGIKEPEFTYCCNPFVGAAWAHGGCVKKALEMCRNCNSWDFNKGQGYDKSSLFDNLGHPAKSSLKAGDVLCSDNHVALYLGGGKIAEASHGDDNVKNSSSWNSSIAINTLTDSRYNGFKRVHRFNSSTNFSTYISHGEVSYRVGYMQSFLKWYGIGIEVDNIFGEATLAAVKQYQKEQGLVVDGIAGKDTLASMPKVKR